MNQRSKTVEILAKYFESKGGILTLKEYKSQQDIPIRPDQVKRVFGNWSRMEKIVRALNARNENKAPPSTNVAEILRETNRLAAEKEELMRAVAEDLEQKHEREMAARRQIESDALNVKTAEGARENKVRKGGPESIDAKTIKESLSRAVAEEHAMLAKTAAGAAEGKELLGGVEDQDAKHAAQARANARTERSALLTATPEGAALAMLEEDDSDGHLTREAHARVRNELRLYTDPATPEKVAEFVEREGAKLRPETRAALERLLDEDIDMSMSAALRGDRARDAVESPDISTETDISKAPPADQEPDEKFAGPSEKLKKEAGIVVEDAPEKEVEARPGKLAGSIGQGGPKAEENKESVNAEQNKQNLETPPADRNPDPKFTGMQAVEKATEESEKENPSPENQTPPKPAVKPSTPVKPAVKK